MPGNPSMGCRFDRIYHSCNNNDINVLCLQHIGTGKIPSVGMTPSDHFGLSLALRLSNSNNKDLKSSVVGHVVQETKKSKRKRKSSSSDSKDLDGMVPSMKKSVTSNMDSSMNKLCNVAENDEDLKLALQLSMEIMTNMATSNHNEYDLSDCSTSKKHENKISQAETDQSRAILSSAEVCNSITSDKERWRKGFLKGYDKRSGNESHVNTSSESIGAIKTVENIIDLSDS